MNNLEEMKVYQEINYINKLLEVKNRANVAIYSKIKKDLLSFNSLDYPYLKEIEETFKDKYNLLEIILKNYSNLNEKEKEYINSIYVVVEEKIDNILWDNISTKECLKNYKKIDLINFSDRIEAISYCKYYYENFDKFSDNEKNDFLKIINENIIYLLAQELNKNQNKTKNEILKNKDFVHKFYKCISNNSNLKKDLYLNHCLSLIMNNNDGALLLNFIKSFNKFSTKVFKNKEMLKENRLFYEKYFCYLNPEYIYDSSLKQEMINVIFEKITPTNLNLDENKIFLNSLNKSIINFVEYYLEINKEITKEILFNENDYFKDYFSKLLGVYKNNLFEVILDCLDDDYLQKKLICAYKEELFEEKYSHTIFNLLNKNTAISKVILENMTTLDIEKQKILFFKYIKNVTLESGNIETFKENLEYMNKDLLKIFDINFTFSILTSICENEEKKYFLIEVKNIVEKAKLKNKLEENLNEKNTYNRVKI